MDSAEDPTLTALELSLCIEHKLIDENTIILLDDIETKSVYIMNEKDNYFLIAKNNRCAAIRIYDLSKMQKALMK